MSESNVSRARPGREPLSGMRASVKPAREAGRKGAFDGHERPSPRGPEVKRGERGSGLA